MFNLWPPPLFPPTQYLMYHTRTHTRTHVGWPDLRLHVVSSQNVPHCPQSWSHHAPLVVQHQLDQSVHEASVHDPLYPGVRPVGNEGRGPAGMTEYVWVRVVEQSRQDWDTRQRLEGDMYDT